MTFDWHMLYPLHTVIFDNPQVFGGVPCKAQLCNFSKWFFSPRFGVVPIWELWQFCYVRIEPPKLYLLLSILASPIVPGCPTMATSPLRDLSVWRSAGSNTERLWVLQAPKAKAPKALEDKAHYAADTKALKFP